MNVVRKMANSYDRKEKEMETTLSWHYFMLSRYFNIYNFYEYEDKIEEFDNPVIYHLPFGKDNIKSGIEETLLKFKGKVPIVMRSYDAHSPLKTSTAYMVKYHDLILSYLSKHVNDLNILFSNMSYDNHLVYRYDEIPKKRKLACMILRRETRKEYHENSNKFKEKKLDLEKIYGLREEVVKYQKIDIYGRNWSYEMPNYKGPLNPHMKKYSVLNEYKFNIIIENVVVDNFLSEKIFDSFLSLSVPVYFGSPRIQDWIPDSCFIDVRNYKNLDDLVDYLENLSEAEYDVYISNIMSHRAKLFDDFTSKKNFAEPLYRWYKNNFKADLNFDMESFEKEENIVAKLKFVNRIGTKTQIKNFIIKLRVKIGAII